MFTLILICHPAHAQTGKQSHLAIGFFAGPHSTVITYAFVSTREGQIIGSQTVRKDRFMYTAMGHWPGIVNIKRQNLLLENDIDSCFLLKDEYDKIVGYHCPVFDELWKVRFSEHPYLYDVYGWSHGKYKPSVAQIEYLHREYGIENILTDYIYGENLYKLLRNIQDKAWISTYSKLAPDPPVNGP